MRHLARAALVAALMIPPAAFAFDSDKWGHDAATRDWFRSLHSSGGTSCCDYTDGVRIEAPDWHENDDGTYSVFAKGEWRRIEKTQVVLGRNRVGYAILWWPENWDAPSCFMPGARG